MGFMETLAARKNSKLRSSLAFSSGPLLLLHKFIEMQSYISTASCDCPLNQSSHDSSGARISGLRAMVVV